MHGVCLLAWKTSPYEFYVHMTVHRNKFLFNKTNRRTNSPNLFLSRNSTCFGQLLCPSSGVFPCTFGTGICHTGLMTVWSTTILVVHETCHVQWKTPDDRQSNCPKHVEFLDKNKYGKLVRLFILLKRNFRLWIYALALEKGAPHKTKKRAPEYLFWFWPLKKTGLFFKSRIPDFMFPTMVFFNVFWSDPFHQSKSY